MQSTCILDSLLSEGAGRDNNQFRPGRYRIDQIDQSGTVDLQAKEISFESPTR